MKEEIDLTEKVIKVIESCKTPEHLICAKKYLDLYCEEMRKKHSDYSMDTEMLEISFDMLYDKIKEKDIWKN